MSGESGFLEDQKPVIQLIDRLGLRSVPSYPGDQPLKNLTQLGKRAKIRETQGLSGIKIWLSSLELSYIVWRLDALSKTVSVDDPYWSTQGASALDSTTVHSYLERHCYFQYTKDLIAIKIRFLCGVDTGAMSVLFLLTYANSNGQGFAHFFNGTKVSTDGRVEALKPHRIANGAFNLCLRLTNNLPADIIHFNQPVQSIVTNDVVCVTSMTGQTYTCKRVICALPPNMANTIEFHPPLEPTKKNILNHMKMGSYLKFVLTYDEAYWIESGYSGHFVSNGGLQSKQFLEGNQPMTVLCDATTYDGVPALVGFLGMTLFSM